MSARIFLLVPLAFFAACDTSDLCGSRTCRPGPGGGTRSDARVDGGDAEEPADGDSIDGTSNQDATAIDQGIADSGPIDLGPIGEMDAAPIDTGPPDTGIVDTGVPDTGPPQPAMWRIETPATLAGAHSSLLLDATDTPMVAYFSDSPRGVYFRTRAGGFWSGPETVDSTVNALEPAMVMSSRLLIVNTVSELAGSRIASWHRSGPSSWTAHSPVNGPDRPDITVNAGVEHMAGVWRMSGPPSSLYYTSRPAGSNNWATPTPIAQGVDWSFAKIGAAGNTVYVLYTQNSELWLARRSTGSWTSNRITFGPAWEFDLVVDGSGTVHIVYYYAGADIINYETWLNNGTTRDRSTSVEAPGGPAPGSQKWSGLSLAVHSGVARVSYLDFTRGGVLRYAVDNRTHFAAETVTAADDVLGQTSLAIDSTGAPHITFPAPAPSFGNLGYAVFR